MDASRTKGVVISKEARDSTGIARPCAGSRNAPPMLSSFSSQLQQTLAPLRKESAMVDGDWEESYNKNLGVQAFLNNMPLLALNEALEKVTLPSKESSVVVANLGCASGPKSIGTVALIVDKLRQSLPKDAEFQAYFNDLASNDFNNLFQHLNNDTGVKNFYAAGAPGSYFDRLFAKSSIHVFYSSNGLLWLSQIPDEVFDKDSPAFNKGSTWILHSRSAVAKSYQRQASRDLKNFLLARAAELISGGLLFFFTFGRSTSEPNEPTNDFLGKSSADLDEIWNDLVGEGILTERQRDTFNIPCYERSMEDLREAIGYCDSLFDVATLKMDSLDLSYGEIFETSETTVLSSKLVAAFKAVMGNSLEAHVGKELSELIWQRYERLVEKKIGKSSEEDLKVTKSICIVSLIRK